MEAQRKQLSSQDEQLKEQWIQQQKEKERLLQVQQERLESLKKKEKHEQSAIASSEVKQRLQEFVLLKKQREAAAAAAKAANHGSPAVNHSGCSSGASSGGSSHNGSGGPGSPSSATSYGVIQPHSVLPHHVHSMYPASHPLHPLHQHLQQQILGQHHYPHPVHQSSLSSSSATKMEPLYSSPSMPNICLGRTSNSPNRVSDLVSSEASSSGVIVGSKTGSRSSSHGITSSGSFSSSQMIFYPSLPVIESAFSPPSSPTSIQNQMRLLEQQSESVIFNNNNVMSGGMTSGVSTSHAGPVRHHHHHHKGIHTSRSPISASSKTSSSSSKNERTSSPLGSPSSPSGSVLHHVNPGGVVVQHQLHHTRHGGIPRNLAKPLERTHSAPLPLGHPMLQASIAAAQAAVNASQVNSGQTPSSTPGSGTGSPSSGVILDPVHQRKLLKEYIRQTVLTRASSKQQLQRLSFEEETEAAVAQEMKEEISHPHPTPTKVRMIKRQYSQEVMSASKASQMMMQEAVDLSKGDRSGNQGRREASSRDSTPDSGIRSFDHQDCATSATSSVPGHLPAGIHPLPSLQGGAPLFHGSLMEMMTSGVTGSPPRLHQGMNVLDPGSSSASSSASSNASASMYQQILVQQQLQLQLQQQGIPQHLIQQQLQQHQLLQQNIQEGQHDQHISILGYHPVVPGAAVSLLPEVNQFPQILPHSRLAFYHHTSGGLSRPLSRALSSPMVFLGSLESSSCSPHSSNSNLTAQHSPPISTGVRLRFTTGIVYDNLMLKHQCICGDNHNHPEHGGRLQSIWARFQETGLVHRCERIRSRKSSLQEIRSCHSEAYTLLFGTSPLNRQKLDPSKLVDLPIKSFVMLPCGGIGVDSDTTWNELHTTSAARTAAGCVTELALKIASGEIKNGFAIVRPPGHHAETQQAMGFCFFNNIAIAVKQVMARMDFERILVIDWDVHHGNGIQQIFYEDPHVLYISLHRHDDGNFFPGTGDPTEVGHEDGMGFNVNIAWSGGLNPPNGDAEYIAAFRSIVLPIARDFDPEMILVACGFDAAAGHPAPMGGYKLSPSCFGWMTRQLMSLARGKVLLSLEGGYDLPSICDSSQECVQSLLEEDYQPRISQEEFNRRPNPNAVEALRRVVAIQDAHWPLLKRFAHLIDCSHSEALGKESDESETVSALASLTMTHITSPPPSASHASTSNVQTIIQSSLTSKEVKGEQVVSSSFPPVQNPTQSQASSSSGVSRNSSQDKDQETSEQHEIDMREDEDEPMDQDLPDAVADEGQSE